MEERLAKQSQSRGEVNPLPLSHKQIRTNGKAIPTRACNQTSRFERLLHSVLYGYIGVGWARRASHGGCLHRDLQRCTSSIVLRDCSGVICCC